MPEILTRAEAAMLRDARVILVRVGIRAQGAFRDADTFGLVALGRMIESAEQAEHGVFNALCVAKHFLDVEYADVESVHAEASSDEASLTPSKRDGNP